MENIANYTNILSTEERIALESLINKLAVRGIKQYYTPLATILFESQDPLIMSEQENAILERFIKYKEDKLIEKACKWLENNTNDFLDGYAWEECSVNIDNLLYDFRKAMEK